MAILEIAVVPIGTGDSSVSSYVAGCQKILADSGLKYTLNPMGTVIEGNIDDLLAIVKKLHESPFEKGAKRVYTNMRIDDRRDKEASMEQKLASVNTKL